jgi:putative phosphoesterase
MKTALISDTHNLLRPEALAVLQGCDQIIHAGDIGNADILAQLAKIAPVHAVRGNNDLNSPWAENLPDLLTFTLNGWATLLVHDIADVPADLDPGIKLIITGHSHKPLFSSVDPSDIENTDDRLGCPTPLETCRQLRLYENEFEELNRQLREE